MSANQGQQLYIIAYDIPEDKRRTKVHRLLCGYGAWTQYSLFECWLSRGQLIELQVKLARHLREQQDSVRFYPLCGACRPGIVTIGSPAPEAPTTFIV